MFLSAYTVSDSLLHDLQCWLLLLWGLLGRFLGEVHELVFVNVAYFRELAHAVRVQLFQVRPLLYLVEDQLEVVKEYGVLRYEVLVTADLMRGRKDGVEPDSKGVFQHIWYYSSQERAASLQARVGVNLYQVHIKLRSYHKVQPEHLEIVLVLVLVKKQTCRSDGINSYSLD